MTDTIALVPTTTDKDKAAAYRAELQPLLEAMCEINTRALRDGLGIGFNIAADQFGICRVGPISVTKPL